jgi:hypothetical protein
MNDNFENDLRRLLRPVDAPTGFAERVMGALPERKTASVVTLVQPPAAPRQQNYWMPAALAASLLISVLLGQRVAVEHNERAEAAGLAASRELMQALRVTSQKLDIAYQAVKNPPQAGAEENRS